MNTLSEEPKILPGLQQKIQRQSLNFRKKRRYLNGTRVTSRSQGKKSKGCTEMESAAIPGGSEEIMLDFGVREMKRFAFMSISVATGISFM